jgi:hypothetical protein
VIRKKEGTQVSRPIRCLLQSSLVFLFSLAILDFIGCERSTPITVIPNPIYTNLAPISDVKDQSVRIPAPEPEPPGVSIIPRDDLEIASVQDLTTAIYFLRQMGGGITTVPSLDPDQFAVHIWDRGSQSNLTADVAVACGGHVTIDHVHGWAIYDHASFPITATARVAGYALETYVQTSGNVLSFGMTRTEPPGTSYVFGVANNLNSGSVRFYTDEIAQREIVAPPSQVNPNFCQFQIPLTSDRIHGFSAFLSGMVENGQTTEPPANPAAPTALLWMSGAFYWDVPPLNPNDHRSYVVSFNPYEPPIGVAHGVAIPPSDYLAIGGGSENQLITVTPTVIFTGDERYIALGPPQCAKGDAPAPLSYACPYFEPTSTADRLVIAGKFRSVDGTDIVQRDWHPGTEAPELVFSGCPTFEIGVGESPGLPMFSWLDPLGPQGDLVRIEAQVTGPVWNITGPAGGFGLDTFDLGIPPEWVAWTPSTEQASYRIQCIDALGQSISAFNEHDIIMWRQESSFSQWLEQD